MCPRPDRPPGLEEARKLTGTCAPRAGLSFNLFALLFLTHSFFPRLRAHTTKFFTLSYYNQKTGQYAMGNDDAYFILFCVTLFTGLRASTMEYLLAPFAKRRGLTKRKDITRFSEQAWILIYYCVFWPTAVVRPGALPRRKGNRR